MAKKKARFGAGAVNVPGYPSNVRLTPNAIAQLTAEGRLPGAQQQQPTMQQPMAQLPMPSPAQIPSASQPLQQGPLAGLMNLGMPPSFAGPTAGMQQNSFGVNAPNLQMPQATPQNTQMQTQVLGQPQQQGPNSAWDYFKYFSPLAMMTDPNWRNWLKENITGTPPKVEGANRFSEFQQKALNYLTQLGIGGISQTPFNFAPIANQQLENFYTNTVPSLAERFTAMGGGQRSSAFQGALANAGRFLGNDLAAQQGQYGLQQQGNLLNMLNLGLTPQSEMFVNPGSPGLMAHAANAAVQAGKAYATGGLG